MSESAPHAHVIPEPVIERLSRLVFSLESANDVGDDALAERYEADITQILKLHPEL